MATPQWATPERKAELVELAIQYKLRRVCLKGHAGCPYTSHYKRVVVKSIPAWKRGLAVTAINRRIVDLHDYGNIAKRSPDSIQTARIEEWDLYDVKEDQATATWKADDREERSYQLRLAAMHAPTGEVGRFGRLKRPGRYMTYDPVEIDSRVNSRPEYYLKGYGIDGQLRRFAKVQIPGTTVILKIDISLGIQELSKNKRKRLRKAGIKPQWTETIIRNAVNAWWGR